MTGPETSLNALGHSHRELMTDEAGGKLATAAPRTLWADPELLAALERPQPRGDAPAARYVEPAPGQPVLPHSVERNLVAAARRGDRRARAELVEAFMPLIASVARLYKGSPGVDRVELLQEGVVGLLRALERYDLHRDTPFWAYAVWWVRQAMQQLVAELTRPVRLSDRALRQLARVRDAHRDAVAETGREPDRAHLAARTGLSGEQIDDLLCADHPPRSLEEPVTAEDGLVGTLGELLVDPLAEGEYERVLEEMEAQELRALLAGLSDREQAILRARYGVDDGEAESLRHIGQRLGISAERVRQLEQRALGKLAAAADIERSEE